MHQLSQLGIDIYSLAGFAVASLLSFTIINPVIVALYNAAFQRVIPQPGNETPDNIKKKRSTLSSDLRLDVGATIGRMERLFYIYAVMSTNFAVLTAWIILKAFFGWIDNPSPPSNTNQAQTESGNAPSGTQAATQQRDKFILYYLYLYGTGLSLLAGLLLGHSGIVFARLVRLIFAQPSG